jgi:hypothetical protein
MDLGRNFKPNILCVAPPYGDRIAAGSAYLLGYLKANGCHEFDFLDLRLGAAFDFTPTYRTTGAFGESYVIDVPDLPLVLMLLEAFDNGTHLVPELTPVFERYCIERGISPQYLQSYLKGLDRYFASTFEQIPHIDFIGFSVWSPNFLSTLVAAAHLKRRPRPPVIVVGGPQVTSSQASAALGLRSRLFDVVVLGEGEATLLDIFSQYAKSGAVASAVPGTAVLDPSSGEVIRLERKLLRLNSLPPPSFEEMPLQAYQIDAGYRAVPFQLSRGCTDKCSFCSEQVFWRSFRSDVPEHAIDQIQQLQQRYDANLIEFCDSLLNGIPRRLTAFVDQLLTREIKIEWTSFMRAQMDHEGARLLARAGCTGVFIGIESFSDSTLELMNKRRTEADNIQAATAFLEAGIHVTAGFIPGFPGDTRGGFLHSVGVLRNLQQRFPGRLELHEEPFTVMAGAPIYSKLGEMGLSPQMWPDEYLDLAPRYRDIGASVICAVEGDNQGMERLGRMAIVGTVKNDLPARTRFDEGSDEELPSHVFEFEHIYAGWYSAEKKSPAGHRYCLLVNEREREQLVDLQESRFPIDEAEREVADILADLEKAHVAPPSRAPRVVRTLYRRHGLDHCTFTVAPHVVARKIGRSGKHRVLVFDTVTRRHCKRSAHDAPIIASLFERARTLRELAAVAQDRDVRRGPEWLSARVDDLKEAGVLVVTDVALDLQVALRTSGLPEAERSSVPPLVETS